MSSLFDIDLEEAGSLPFSSVRRAGCRESGFEGGEQLNPHVLASTSEHWLIAVNFCRGVGSEPGWSWEVGEEQKAQWRGALGVGTWL